jgi:hypothetical protein
VHEDRGRKTRERERVERESKFEGRERKLKNFEGRQFSRGREDVGRDEWNLNFF